MPALRTRDTQSRPLEVSTDAPQPPTLTIISPTPRTFNFPISHTLNDSPSSTPSSSPFEPDHRLSLSCITPPLMRNLSPDSISSASPAPSTPKRRKSSTGPSGTSPDAERRPRKGDQDYIKRPENAFILFRRSRCESRQLDTDSASDNTSPSAATKKQRQADLSKTISQQWKSLSPEERQHWERLAKQKKKEHEERYPDYVYRPQRVKDRDGKVRNKKRQPKQQVTVHEFSPLATSPAEAADGYHNFLLRAPRQHGRSASAPTPPPMHYQAIQIPRMPQIVASPSCPASPSLIASPTSSEVPPMISRRATDAFEYQHLMPPAFSQAGYEFQSSDYLRSMFNIPHTDLNAISPSSTTVPTPSEHATPIGLPPQIHTSGLLPSPNIISPASASSGCSSGPTSPSHFLSQPDFQPQIHGQGYEYSPNSYPPEYSQFPDMS
ncbi:slightly ste11-like protein, partial [Stygiomarasmius scandens]